MTFHKQTHAEATILVTRVADPSKFGVVIHEEGGRVKQFVEKPTAFVGDWINAGVYILNNSCIDRIPPGPCSIEKEIFPQMAKDGTLFCFRLDGYWADIGQPKDFLHGMSLYLQELKSKQHTTWVPDTKEGGAPVGPHTGPPPEETLLPEGPHVIGNVLVDPSVRVGEGCVLGPNVTVDSGVVLGRGCRLKNCALMAGVSLADFCCVDSAIIGWRSALGKWVRIEGLTVVGEKVRVAAECLINGAFILPHKTITQSILDPGAIIM